MEDRINQIQAEITALKSLLRDTDYTLFRLVEDMTDCTTIIQLIAAFTNFLHEYREVVVQRRAWRKRINELEDEAAEIEASLAESEISDTETEVEGDDTAGTEDEADGNATQPEDTESETPVDDPEPAADGE